MTEEVWKDIPGYEGLYQVSNLGRVKSLRFNKEKILKQSFIKGYYDIKLAKNKVGKRFSIHRLVYMTFKGPIPEGLQVNHINEIKSDNRPENLNLLTPKENTNWGTRNERASEAMKGKNVGKPKSEETRKKLSESNKGKPKSEETKKKLSEANTNGKCSKSVLQYDLNGNFITEWPSLAEVERQLKIHHSGISQCCSGKLKSAGGYIWHYKSI